MTTYNTELPVRSDLIAAHQATVAHWSRPGTWWSAADRLAMVAQVRRARDIDNPPPAWVPASDVEGLVGDSGALPPKAVDAIWRITNHPGTLTVEWYRSIVDDEDPSAITPSHYTELVGVVAQANALDRFADALSVDRLALPGPVAGEPSQIPPADLAQRDHWVPTTAGGKQQVIRALSGVPAEREMMLALGDVQYLPIDEMSDLTTDRNSLSRMQVELVAARTSKLNECFY